MVIPTPEFLALAPLTAAQLREKQERLAYGNAWSTLSTLPGFHTHAIAAVNACTDTVVLERVAGELQGL